MQLFHFKIECIVKGKKIPDSAKRNWNKVNSKNMSAYVYTLVCTLQRLKGNVVLAFFKVGFITTGFELQCTYRFRLLFTEIIIREYQIKILGLNVFLVICGAYFPVFWGQFHQNFTRAFFIQKQIAQLFSNYRSALWLYGKRISSKNARVKCWWNWLQVLESQYY